MRLDKSQVRTFGGRAAFMAFMSKVGHDMGPKDWDALSEGIREAWIAAAHESCMLQWIIESHNKPKGAA